MEKSCKFGSASAPNVEFRFYTKGKTSFGRAVARNCAQTERIDWSRGCENGGERGTRTEVEREARDRRSSAKRETDV